MVRHHDAARCVPVQGTRRSSSTGRRQRHRRPGHEPAKRVDDRGRRGGGSRSGGRLGAPRHRPVRGALHVDVDRGAGGVPRRDRDRGQDPAGRIHVVATLRADFYDRPLAVQRFGALVGDATVAVPPMSPAELEAAIVRPVEALGAIAERGARRRAGGDGRQPTGRAAVVAVHAVRACRMSPRSIVDDGRLPTTRRHGPGHRLPRRSALPGRRCGRPRGGSPRVRTARRGRRRQ